LVGRIINDNLRGDLGVGEFGTLEDTPRVAAGIAKNLK